MRCLPLWVHDDLLASGYVRDQMQPTIADVQCRDAFRDCWPAAVELSLILLTLFIGFGLVRDFGWRVYRKFGATDRGNKLKVMYRKRMVFVALLKLDVTLDLVVLLAATIHPYSMCSTPTPLLT